MSSDHLLNRFSPLLLLVVGATIISFAPVFVKLVGVERLGPTAIGFWRTFFGSVTLFTMVALRGGSFRLPARLMGMAALVGLIFFGDLFVWHRSIVYSGAGMATILGNTQVFATAIISYFVFKEKLTVRYFFAAVSAMIGVVLLVGVLSDQVIFDDRYVKGIMFGLSTGLFYASFLVTLKWSGYKQPIRDVMLFMAWMTFFSTSAFGVASAMEGVRFLPPDLSSWIYLALLGIFVQALAWWLITNSLHQSSASRAGLILLLQPTLAMVWGVVLFAEQFSLPQLIGAIITLTAIYFGGLKSENQSTTKKERPA